MSNDELPESLTFGTGYTVSVDYLREVLADQGMTIVKKGELAEATALARAEAAPVCANCGKPATCLGSYESNDAWAFACSECCGHGNEDGQCFPVADIPARYQRLAAADVATPAPAATADCECFEPAYELEADCPVHGQVGPTLVERIEAELDAAALAGGGLEYVYRALALIRAAKEAAS